MDSLRFYIDFSYGGVRLTQANDLDGAKKEAAQSAVNCRCSVRLLNDKYSKLAEFDYKGIEINHD